MFCYNKKNSFRLEIANVDARDMGTYKAVARNASGEGHATINLTFEEGMYIFMSGIPTGTAYKFRCHLLLLGQNSDRKN